MKPDIGKPYLRAVSNLQALALFEIKPGSDESEPKYQQIAPKAFQLQQLELNNSSIAKRLGVTDKTVAKAIAWFRCVEHQFNG